MDIRGGILESHMVAGMETETIPYVGYVRKAQKDLVCNQIFKKII